MISLVFWAITIIVSIKYVVFIMRADNEGEGGIMALIALIRNVGLQRRSAQVILVALGIFGASLFYGDGMITPAISVLSAVEGISVVEPSLDSLVVPAALAILTVLFTVQRFGTGAVGRLFGPVMAVWFTILAVAGLHEVVKEPAILRAISPSYGITFMFEHGHTAFIALGSVVLDGHRRRGAVRGHGPLRALADPARVVHRGLPGARPQLHGPGRADPPHADSDREPVLPVDPDWGRIPMVALATVATVIASQAVISGAFSVTRQAVQLGFLPRLTILHTSREAGQVYVPGGQLGDLRRRRRARGRVRLLGAPRVGLRHRGHRHARDRHDAVLRRRAVLWKKPAGVAIAGARVFLLVDLAFFAANLPKVLHGGWFPLAIAAVVFVVLTTWQRGREIVTTKRRGAEGPLDDFIEEIRDPEQPISRVPRTGIFLDANPETTPLALRANVEHNYVLHENVVIVSVQTLNVPHVDESERVTVDDLGYRDDGITHVTGALRLPGRPRRAATLRKAAERLEREVDFDNVSYFLSRITIVATDEPGMVRWRKKLFIAIARNSASPVPYFHLPDERTVVMASHVEL